MRVESGPAEASVYLLRHGKTAWNKERRYIGHTDQPLDIDELPLLEDAKDQLRGAAFTAVYCSDLIRAKQTLLEVRADWIGHAVFDDRLRELHFGSWEGKTYEDLSPDPQYSQWLIDQARHAPPGGETTDALHGRIIRFAADVIDPLRCGLGVKNDILIVSHGGPVRMLLTYLLPELSFWDLDVPCGSLYKVGLGSGTWTRLA
ncbi:histidine phosphatase family protein [Paenibacillus abyssi]|uniref:Alpha-ribazole phosphatase n=1 Tax=Paenibacillus abyssi TaxID=1340531 RepID=A0A917D5F5_9BACL|nr:histidine phosphatase family protein [Paenibacillus abyssi]GGG11601.1 alpha-ribazole phosphatase [Paenibacillus abyssi]